MIYDCGTSYVSSLVYSTYNYHIEGWGFNVEKYVLTENVSSKTLKTKLFKEENVDLA